MRARTAAAPRGTGSDWQWRVLACPRCHGRLTAALNLVRCAACGPYPRLGGVPILVPDPAAWCATFRDSVLAALAEHGLATREAVHVVGAFAQGRAAEAQRFGDDWTPHEVQGEAPPTPVKGPAQAVLRELAAAGLAGGPSAWLGKHLGTVKVAFELGCGAGLRSEQLSAHARHLVVGDLSLRAVLHARSRASRRLGQVAGVVCDAPALPVARGAVDLLVAENLVDLVDEPARLLESVRDALRRTGRALVTTPAPSLGSGDDGALKHLAHAARLEVLEARDGLPWLRVNSARHLELYLVQALALARTSGRR